MVTDKPFQVIRVMNSPQLCIWTRPSNKHVHAH